LAPVCDRLRRRDLLKLGALGLGFGSLNLADLLRAEGQCGIQLSGKMVIIFISRVVRHRWIHGI